MASGPDWCCCCDSDYVSETNTAILDKIGAFLGDECKPNPLQCDPVLDCSACEAEAATCEELTAENIPNLASGDCDGTASSASCDTYTCIAGYIANGGARCNNGKWDVSDAKCLAPCAELTAENIPHLASGNCDDTASSASCYKYTCDAGYIAVGDAVCNNGEWDVSGAKCNIIDWCVHKSVPGAIYKPAYHISKNYKNYKPVPNSTGSQCRGGVDLGLRMAASTLDECAQACHSSTGSNPQNLSRASLLHKEWSDPKWNGVEAASFSFQDYSFLPSDLRGKVSDLSKLDYPETDTGTGTCFCHPMQFEACLINNENDHVDWVGRYFNVFNKPDPNFAYANPVVHYDFEITKIDASAEPEAPFKMSYLKQELGAYPFIVRNLLGDGKRHSNTDVKKYTCDPTALEDRNNSVDGVLTRGQTCLLNKAIVVPACTHLFLKGGEGGGEEAAILSGGKKTQHFRINGKLTLRDLVLEKGIGVFGGSIQVQGLFAQAHLIDTTIRNCHAERPATHALIRLAGGGAVHANVGMGQRELVRGVNDDVRLILEGNTQILDNTAYEGKFPF